MSVGRRTDKKLSEAVSKGLLDGLEAVLRLGVSSERGVRVSAPREN